MIVIMELIPRLFDMVPECLIETLLIVHGSITCRPCICDYVIM